MEGVVLVNGYLIFAVCPGQSAEKQVLQRIDDSPAHSLMCVGITVVSLEADSDLPPL